MRVDELPTIDLRRLDDPTRHDDLAGQIREAGEEVGFFAIVNHGADWSLVERIYSIAERFHALPIEVKLGCQMEAGKLGYSPIGNQARNGRVAVNEAYFMAHPRSRRTQWPPAEAIPEFREAVSEYFAVLDGLGHRPLPLYAIGLGLPPDYFDPFFTPSMATLRLTRYPPVATAAGDEQWGIDAHSDAGFLTMLPANTVDGLWICRPDGSWFEPRQEPESFVVNSGDMIHRWSNGRLRSTTHRVKNVSGGDRYAAPYFFDPRGDTIIECLPTCAVPGEPPRFEPIRYLDYINTFMAKGYDAFRPASPDRQIPE
jgi:isopenicillin N synthase-like dioxygenase